MTASQCYIETLRALSIYCDNHSILIAIRVLHHCCQLRLVLQTSLWQAASVFCNAQAFKLSLQAGSYEDLVKYLLMVRKKAKDSKIDTELVYAYAKTKQLGPLEEFISSPNQANLQVSKLHAMTYQLS